jgi:hypothetical protein
VLYVPSLYDLFTGIWSSDEQMHGPIVLGMSQDIFGHSAVFKYSGVDN